jgi:hypothetical protein
LAVRPISLSGILKGIIMDIVDLPLEQIIPYARNPKRKLHRLRSFVAPGSAGDDFYPLRSHY